MKSKSIKTVTALSLAIFLSVSAGGCTNAEIPKKNPINPQKIETKMPSNQLASSELEFELDTSDLFSNRDLKHEVDLEAGTNIVLESGKDILIDKEGIYVLKGDVKNVTVRVETSKEEKVQLVLAGVRIINESSPAIYVKSADKVFVTTTESNNYMEVSGYFIADEETNLDAVIFSKEDITFNGTGVLEIESTQGNGISSKDDLKITGGTYNIKSKGHALEANDSIRIYDGTLNLDAGKDGLHSENNEDDSLGYIYIKNGTINIIAGDDAIRGNSLVQIDEGIINIESCEEGIEATSIKINGGDINIYAKDDGINAARKTNHKVAIEVNGGNINIKMASGDTDAFDSNGDITINAGTINIEAVSAFDSDGVAILNGGDVTVNGQKITQITQNQMRGRGNFREPRTPIFN